MVAMSPQISVLPAGPISSRYSQKANDFRQHMPLSNASARQVPAGLRDRNGSRRFSPPRRSTVSEGAASPTARKRPQPDGNQPFFFGNAACGDMPLDDSSETVGPAAGFFAFGFFGSRLPRFMPLAIKVSRALVRISANPDTPNSSEPERWLTTNHPPFVRRCAMRRQDTQRSKTARCRRPESRDIGRVRIRREP
jgi:hypothetical protein